MSTNPYLSLTTLAGLSSLLDTNKMMVVVNPGDGQGSATTVGSISLPDFRDNYLLVTVNEQIVALQAKPGNGAFVTPITMSFTGVVTGSVSFDGSSNVSAAMTMPDGSIPISAVVDLASTIATLESEIGPATSLTSSYYSSLNGAQTTVLGYWNPSSTGLGGSESQYGTILQLTSDGSLAPSATNYVNQLMLGTDGTLTWRQNVNNTAWNIVNLWHSGNLNPTGFVHTTGVESIAGAKTFTDVVTINAALNVTGIITLTGDMLPDVDNTRSLGSPTLQWKDVYVGPGSLYVNGQQVLSTDASHDVVVSADVDQNISIQPQGTADLILSPQGTGGIQVKGPWILNSGFKLISSDGYALKIGDDFTFDSGKGFTGGLLVDANEVWHAGNFNPANYVLASGSFGGNAATATKLQTPRLINGQSFDGTADITIGVAVTLSDINSALAAGNGPIVQTASYSTSAANITNGVMINQSTVIVTDNSTAASGVVSSAVFDRFGYPTLAAVNSGVTYTNAYTVFIGGAPFAGSNVIITNPWALYVNSGNTYLGGGLQVSGSVGIGTVPTAVPGTGNPVVGANNLVMYNAGDLGLTMLTDNAATRTQQIGFGSQGVSLFDAGMKWDNASRGLGFWSGGAQHALLDVSGNLTTAGFVSATGGLIAANGSFTKDGTHGFAIDGSNNISFNAFVLYNNAGFELGVGSHYWAFNTNGTMSTASDIILPNGAGIRSVLGGKLSTGPGGDSWIVQPADNSGNAFVIADYTGTAQWTWDTSQNLSTAKAASFGGVTITTTSINGLIVSSSTTNSTGILLNNTSSGGHEWTLGTSGSAGPTAAGTLVLYDNTSGGVQLTLGGNALSVPGSITAVTGIHVAGLDLYGTSSGAGTNNVLINFAGNRYLTYNISGDYYQFATTRLVVDGSLSAAGITSGGQVVSNMGALGTTANASLIGSKITVTTSNVDNLLSYSIRLAAGTSWTTAAWRLQRLVDATYQDFIQLGEGTGVEGIYFGNNSTVHTSVSSAGAWTYQGNLVTPNLTATSGVYTNGIGAYGTSNISVTTNAQTFTFDTGGGFSAPGKIQGTNATITTVANAGNGGNYGVVAHSANGQAAVVTFIRDGAFGCYLGFGTDSNDIKIGGWSFGNASYRVVHEGLSNPVFSGDASVSSGNRMIAGAFQSETGYSAGNPAGTAYRASGSYGGGYGLVDGSYGITLYSTGGTLCFAFGSSSSVTQKATLDTNGNFSTTGTVSGNRIVLGYDSGVANSVSLSDWVRSSGNVGWYSASYGGGVYMIDATYVRAYNGKAMAASDFVVTSDKNQKKHIRDLEYRGRLIPRSFTMRETNKGSFGFVAQEVRKLYPEAVSDWNTPGEKYLSVSYNLLTAVLAHQVNTVEDDLAAAVKLIQKQQEQIDELQAMMKKVVASVQRLH